MRLGGGWNDDIQERHSRVSSVIAEDRSSGVRHGAIKFLNDVLGKLGTMAADLAAYVS